MLRLLSTLRRSVLIIEYSGLIKSVEHAQHGGALLRQLGAGSGREAAAEASLHLDALRLPVSS